MLCWCLGVDFPCVTLLSYLFLAFQDQISFLIVGCVTTWSRDSHQLQFLTDCNLEQTKELQRQVDELMEMGYIRESMSPCVVLVLLMSKKDETWRIYVDCWVINNIMVFAILTWLKPSKPMHSMSLSLIGSLNHLEYVMGPCWCFWVDPPHIPIVLVPWSKFLLCHTPIRPISAFQDQISVLIMDCMTAWSRSSHHFCLMIFRLQLQLCVLVMW